MQKKSGKNETEKIAKPAKKVVPNEGKKTVPIVERKNYSERPHGRTHDTPLGSRNPKGVE